jgi:hypothetical protein
MKHKEREREREREGKTKFWTNVDKFRNVSEV